MNIVKTVQNWIDPLPPVQTASTLEEARNKVMLIDNRFDVSIEWVENLHNKGGKYSISPVREDCCGMLPTEASQRAQATKKVMRTELESTLNKLSSTTTSVASKAAALISTRGQETEADRQEAIAKIKTFIQKIDDAHTEKPDAPVNREFLTNVFFDRNIQNVTEESPFIQDDPASKTASRLASTAKDESSQIQEKEVREIVELINSTKTKIAEKNLTHAEVLLANQDPGIYRRREFEAQLKNASRETKELVNAIRSKGSNYRANWIDRSLADAMPITLDTALNHVISQFA